jgi:hypothetical protein
MIVKRKGFTLQVPELVVFDVNNPEHRAAYVSFLKDNKWPIRFKYEPPFSSVPQMIMYKLALKACEAEVQVDLEELMSKSIFGSIVGDVSSAKLLDREQGISALSA